MTNDVKTVTRDISFRINEECFKIRLPIDNPVSTSFFKFLQSLHIVSKSTKESEWISSEDMQYFSSNPEKGKKIREEAYRLELEIIPDISI